MEKKIKIAIIGSGPSAVSSAWESLKKTNVSIEMLDCDLKPDIKQIFFSSEIYNNDLEAYKKLISLNLKNNKVKPKPDKLFFGSDFVYRSPKEGFLKKINSKFFLSFSKGGLGNVWGANTAEFTDDDLKKWPIKYKDLKPFYESLKEIIHLNSSKLNITKKIFNTNLVSLQAQYILQNLLKKNTWKKYFNVYRAQLALDKNNSIHSTNCSNCGMCLSGCPSNIIFNPKVFIHKKLMAKKNFKYVSNKFIYKYEEIDGQVKVYYIDLVDGKEKNKLYDILLIGAGVISTTVITARSLGIQTKIKILDSQKYLFPFFLNNRINNIFDEKSIKLSQIVIHSNKKVHKNITHTQLYPYNEMILEFINSKLKIFPINFLKKIFKYFLSRVMIGMTYLDSSDSGYLIIDIEPDHKRGYGVIKGYKNKLSKKVSLKVFDNINNLSSFFGGKIFKLFSIEQNVGNSQHLGCSFPMAINPKKNQTDIYGRPKGFKKVFLIDSTSFNSIPAKPLTYTIMANASRITNFALKTFT